MAASSMGPSVLTYHGLTSQPACPTLLHPVVPFSDSLYPSLTACSPSVSSTLPLHTRGDCRLPSPGKTSLPASGGAVAQPQPAAEAFPGHSLHPWDTRSPPESRLPFAALPGQLSLLVSPGGKEKGHRTWDTMEKLLDCSKTSGGKQMKAHQEANDWKDPRSMGHKSPGR